VYCQLGYLGDCLPGRIRHALEELPETLDGTYERTLQEIKSTNWELARRLFLCVTVASRPLRVEELAEFLAFDLEAGRIPKFRKDWRVENPLEAVLSTCSTLLALVNIEDSSFIQFSHFSVKEFLTSTRFAEKHDIISCRYHVAMTPAHTFVAQACLGILLHLDENITTYSLKDFPLAEYAAEHWVEHVHFEDVSEHVEEGMRQLFDGSKPHLAIWAWIYDPTIPWKGQKRFERPLPPHGSPLHYATFCDLPSIVKALAIEHPQDVSSRGFDDESTPLHLASRMGYVEIARLLIEHGADVATQHHHGWTALHWAARAGSMDLASLLIEHGADVTIKDNDGWSPFHWAVSAESVGLARLLIEHGASVTARDNRWWTPLHKAVEARNVDLVRFLIEHGAYVIAQNDVGRTPLHLAIRNGSIDLVRLLVEHGADTTAHDHHGSVRWVVDEGNVDLAHLPLEEDGVDLPMQYGDEWIPLHLALGEERVDIAQLLVERGADVTSQNEYGWTPLHRAVVMKNMDLARLFIEHGATATVQDNEGWTALHRAVHAGNVDLARLFVEHGADMTAPDYFMGWTVLHSAVQAESEDPVRVLVEHGADATTKDNYGRTPLHLAVLKGSTDLVRLLVEHGADVIVRDDDGSTLLHWAVLEGREDLARLLIEHGAQYKHARFVKALKAVLVVLVFYCIATISPY